MNDSSISAHIKTLYKFFNTKDPEYTALETKIHIQLTKSAYRAFLIFACLVMYFSDKSIYNMTVVFALGFLIQFFMNEKTAVLMKFFILAGIFSFPLLRFSLVGPESAIFNQIHVLLSPLTVLTFTNSLSLGLVTFVYTFGFTHFNMNFVYEESRRSFFTLETSFNFFKENCQVLNFLVLTLVFLLVCQKQALLANLWQRQQEKDELIRQMKIKNKELKELNASKTRLLLGLSHEFRNPINAALGNLELGVEKITDPTALKYLMNCRASIGLIFHLVSNLLDSTKLEAGVLEQSRVVKKSRGIFDKVWGITRNALDKKNLTGEFYVDKTIPQMLNVDSHFLSKIMLNLLLNAVKYTQEGGVMTVVTWVEANDLSEDLLQPSDVFFSRFTDNFTRKKKVHHKTVTAESSSENLKTQANEGSLVLDEQFRIPTEMDDGFHFSHIEDISVHQPSIKVIESFHSASNKYDKFSNKSQLEALTAPKSSSGNSKIQTKKNGYLKIEVFDSGCGMDPYLIKDMIFQKFSSVSLETGDRLGLGLGLWLTKNLCERLGGQLRAYSEKDKGSQFIAMIPMESPDFIQAEEFRPNGSATLTALVVDDDKFNRELNIEFLTRAGVVVKGEASNGQEAVDIFTSKPAKHFDIVVMDLEMPIMGGKEATKKIRSFETAHNRPPVKVVIATGNCDLAEYTDCMKTDGDIRADFFYRKPLARKDFEEFVEILLRNKASQNTCLSIGMDSTDNELLKKLLGQHQIRHIPVNSVEDASNILNDKQTNLKWVIVDLNMLQGHEELQELLMGASSRKNKVEIIGFEELLSVDSNPSLRKLGITKVLGFPFADQDILEVFGVN